MKYGLIYAACLVLAFASCEKNKFTTEPQLEEKSIGPETVFNGDIISFRSKFTDKEGDLDSAFAVYKWFDGAAVVRADTIRMPFDVLNLPPRTTDGEILIEFSYGQFIPPYLQLPGTPVPRDTTSAIGLVLLDKAKHRSNYIESKQIRLIKP